MPDTRIIEAKRKKIKSIFLPMNLLYCILTSSLVKVCCFVSKDTHPMQQAIYCSFIWVSAGNDLTAEQSIKPAPK